MIKTHFDVSVRCQGNIATIDLYGELTASAKLTLEAAYTEAESQNPEIIWFNFAEVDYINSTGIALLISLLIRARQSSRNLMIYGLRPFYVELFELAGLMEYIPVL